MSTSALSSALSGLRTAQKALDVTSSNIANAGVEGYTKKTLDQQSVSSSDGIGIGVRFGEVQRYVDQYVQRDYRTQLGTQGFYTTQESYLSRITALQGSTDDSTNISAQISNLYNGFVNLSSTPDSAAIQSSVVSQAVSAANTFNKLSQQMLDMRNDAQSQLKGEVDNLNSSLTQIAELNKKIQTAHNIGQSTAALEDQRDSLIKTVSAQLNISSFTNGDGVVVLQTADGHVLADTEARKLSVDSSTLTYGSSYPSTVGGLVLQGDQPGTSVDLAAGTPGGTIGALLDVRDNKIPAYQAQLDELADKLMMRFNDQGLRLFTDQNGTIPANNPTQYVGIAASIKVNTAVLNNNALVQQGTTGPAINTGSNAVIMNVVNYTFGKYKDAAGTPNVAFNSTNLGGGGNLTINVTNDPNATLTTFSSSMLDSQAADYNSVKISMDNVNQYTQEVQSRLLAGSSVNTDEELGKMIELQKSYSANAKMISALDELFRDLLNAIN